MLKNALIGLLFLTLSMCAYGEWQTQKFMNPDFESLHAEIKYFTGYDLIEPEAVLKVSRNRPSPLMGDYSSCTLLKLSDDEFKNFLKTVPTTKAINREWGCPQNAKLSQEISKYDYEQYAYRQIDSDEYCLILLDRAKNVILLYIVVH